MPYILTDSSIIICPHGGQLKHSTNYGASGSLMLDGHFVFFYDDSFYISGCAIGCDRVEWQDYYKNVIFRDRYFLTTDSTAQCRHPTKGYMGYALLMFFQTRIDVEELVRLASKKT
jgi:hypothetical protein